MKNITVLAVDDIEANRISLQYLIDEYIDNVELLLASSGEDALKITYTNDLCQYVVSNNVSQMASSFHYHFNAPPTCNPPGHATRAS